MKNKIIPYNPNLKGTARMLRRRMTLGEIILWQKIRKKQINGIKFSRQIRIDNFIVDFYSKELQLAIEVDGSSHDSRYAQIRDRKRENKLRSLGVRFIRFRDEEVRNNLPEVLDKLRKKVSLLQKPSNRNQ